jgi:D-alanine--poly(phosphoribitol) ligase subunit 1
VKDFIELIKDNTKNYPDRIAVIDGETRISYADFFYLVNSISQNLIIRKSKPKIVFDLKQGLEAYALIVAVLNVGGTYCPLNPDAPIERKMQIINEFGPDFIVAETEENILEFNSAKAITIKKLISEKNYKTVENDYNGEDIIYVIYTSGSTGMPKGVKVCRKALNKFLDWSIPTYAATENDVWGQFSFLSFDLSIVDIFTCLCSGATLFAMNDIPTKKNRPAGIIEKEKITVWHSIPSAVEFMKVNERQKVYDFSSLRLMSFCGEPLRKHQVDFLFEKKKDLIIFNTYGPTEGTLFCTWQELRSESYLNYCDFTMSIGKAIPGWNLKLNAVENFVEKEILIYGDYIGKGYLGIVADTKFKELEIEGISVNAFETGDLVTEKNGNLYFSCRSDRQIKIKGFRVELDEIDFTINEFLNKTSITVAKKDSLYSFIETEEKINEPELRRLLKKKLESFKIPTAFYFIKEIPRSQNQKVDVKILIGLLP